ncbi:MAG: N-acetylglucosamine kinase [Rhizobiaceae bacterium]|nr:N-acetylglucosamine kinase [Rhizobiaceae bacterium]
MSFVLGIDGGGTSCRAAVAGPDGVIVGRGASGSANIRTDLSGARASIVNAAELALSDAGLAPEMLSQCSAVLGLAGANVGTYASQVEAILPFAASKVVSDALIALEGAVGSGDGAIAILGTGTAYMSRKSGVVRAIGGWGFVIGDQGSGARIGRDLLEETLLAHDGVVPASPLTNAVLAIYRNDPRDVVEFTTSAKPGDFGGFAPLVFDHAAKGDETALRIIERARQSIEASLGALDPAPETPLCLLGGLAQMFAPRLSPRYQVSLRPPLQDALGGAVSMAARMLMQKGSGDD